MSKTKKANAVSAMDDYRRRKVASKVRKTAIKNNVVPEDITIVWDDTHKFTSDLLSVIENVMKGLHSVNQAVAPFEIDTAIKKSVVDLSVVTYKLETSVTAIKDQIVEKKGDVSGDDLPLYYMLMNKLANNYSMEVSEVLEKFESVRTNAESAIVELKEKEENKDD